MSSSLGISLAGIQTSQFDPEALAFISAAGITDITERYACNNLVCELKIAGLWNILPAIYPFLGGTSTTTKWNLKDPRDLDAAFRITWYGGMTFDSLGILGNGTNSGGDSHLNSQALGFTQMVLACYINQNFAPEPETDYDMGGYDGSDDFLLILGYNNKTTKYVNFLAGSFESTSSGTYTRSLLLGQNNGVNVELYQDTSRLINKAQSFGDLNMNMGIANSWRDLVNSSSRRGYSIMFIGNKALTSGQVTDLNNIVNKFNTILSR